MKLVILSEIISLHVCNKRTRTMIPYRTLVFFQIKTVMPLSIKLRQVMIQSDNYKSIDIVKAFYSSVG